MDNATRKQQRIAQAAHTLAGLMVDRDAGRLTWADWRAESAAAVEALEDASERAAARVRAVALGGGK